MDCDKIEDHENRTEFQKIAEYDSAPDTTLVSPVR